VDAVTHNDYQEMLIDLPGLIPMSIQISKAKTDKFQEQSLRVFPPVLLSGVLPMITFTYAS